MEDVVDRSASDDNDAVIALECHPPVVPGDVVGDGRLQPIGALPCPKRCLYTTHDRAPTRFSRTARDRRSTDLDSPGATADRPTRRARKRGLTCTAAVSELLCADAAHQPRLLGVFHFRAPDLSHGNGSRCTATRAEPDTVPGHRVRGYRGCLFAGILRRLLGGGESSGHRPLQMSRTWAIQVSSSQAVAEASVCSNDFDSLRDRSRVPCATSTRQARGSAASSAWSRSASCSHAPPQPPTSTGCAPG